MEFIPFQVLRNEPTALRKKLEDEGELVVTVDGKPFAVMIDLAGGENIDDNLFMVSRLRAHWLRAPFSQARCDGLDKLSEEQVDELIQKTRAERKY